MPITAEQKEERKNFIGASDVPMILGVSPWGNALRVYKEKLGLVPSFKGNTRTRLGELLEEGLLQLTSEELGYPILPNQRRVKGIFAANNDGLVDGLPIGVEVKTTTEEKDWGEEYTDEVPMHVLMQTQAQAYCGDLDVVYVPALVAGRFRLYRVEREDSLIDEIVARGTQFWEEHVLKQVPPEGTDTFDTLEVARQAGKVAPIKAEDYLLLQELKAQEKEVKDAIESVKESIIQQMGDAEIAECEHGLLTYKKQGRTNFDTKALRLEHPDLYEKFASKSEHYVMREKKRA